MSASQRLTILGLAVALMTGCAAGTPEAESGPATDPAPPALAAIPAPEPTPEPEPEPPKHVDPPKIALVLGGGGARGFAHVGVLRVLEQEKIPIDMIVGTSVGSLIGAMYAADPNTFELEWKSFKIEEDDLFDFPFLPPKTGPVKGDAVIAFVNKSIKQKTIESLKIPFVAIAADLNTGKRVEFDSGPIATAVRASVSIPGVFTPARVQGRTLVDGGVVANLAVDTAKHRGADIVIASNITENVVDYEVTNVVSIILQAINIMMAEMADVQVKQAEVVITPDIGDVGTMDFTQKKRCMQEGIRASQKQVKAIRGAIEKYYEDRGGVAPASLVLRTE